MAVRLRFDPGPKHPQLNWPPGLRAAFLLCALVTCALVAGCAGGNPQNDVPYPAFVVSDELADAFIAVLPGVRAKPFASDIRSGALSARVDIPADWQGTTGGATGKALEIFVLAGSLRLSDFELGPGGYAYVPPGSLGFRLASDDGARLLYFLEEPDAAAVIRSPIILDSGRLDWEPVANGVHRRMLREDPGSGNTWLVRVAPGADLRWQSSSAGVEGYLVAGALAWSECVAGEVVTGNYAPGGYFRRPAGRVHGGPASSAEVESVWFFREQARGEVSDETGC